MMLENHIVDQEQQKSLLDVYYWIRLASKYRWKILGPTVIATLAVAVYVKTIPPTYVATSSIIVEENRDNVISIDEVSGAAAVAETYLMTQVEVLQSKKLASKVVSRLQLQNHPEFGAEEATDIELTNTEADSAGVDSAQRHLLEAVPPVENTGDDVNVAVEILIGNLEAAPVFATQVLEINYYAENPQLAAMVANTLADVYLESKIEEKLEASDQAIEWLSGRMDVLLSKLRTSESELQAYREQNQLIDAGGISLNAEESGELNRKHIEAKRTRSELETIVSEIAKIQSSQSSARLSDFPSILQNPLIQELKQQKTIADRKVNELSKRYGPLHPKLIAAQSDAQAISLELGKRARLVAQGFVDEYRVALENENNLNQVLSEAKHKVLSDNRNSYRLNELEREVDTNRQLYDLFLKRYKEAGQAKGLETSQARLLDSATTPRFPVKPNKQLMTFMGFAISLIIFTMIASLYDLYKFNYVEDPEDVESKLGVNILGFIPDMKKWKLSDMPACFSGANNLFAESIKSIRTAILLSKFEKQKKVILVTSSIPGEGKSTLSFGLAYALSEMEKVLLIEADLRRPSLASMLGHKPAKHGLSHAINGVTKFSDCIFHHSTTLDIVFAEDGIQNPLEILMSKKFEFLLKSVADRYDRVIIDSAPVFTVSDSTVLSSYTDAVIYVVGSKLASTKIIKKGIRKLADVKAPVLGVALNRFNIRRLTKSEAKFHSGYNYWSTNPKGQKA